MLRMLLVPFIFIGPIVWLFMQAYMWRQLFESSPWLCVVAVFSQVIVVLTFSALVDRARNQPRW